MEFEWCFPAEPDPTGRLKACCTRSTLPSFEYLCVLSTACITLMVTASQARMHGDYVVAAQLYHQCHEIVRLKCSKAIGFAMNQSQWHKLRRETLPIQLLPTWLSVLAAKAAHSAQLCAILYLSEDESPEAQHGLLALTRQAYVTIKMLARCSRRLLVLEHFLRPSQQDTVEELQQDVVKEAHRLQLQCLLQEVEPLLMRGQAPLAKAMLQCCRRSAHIVWPEEEVLEEEDATLKSEVLRQVASLEDTASKSTSMVEDAGEDHIEAYVQSLPHLRWQEVLQ